MKTALKALGIFFAFTLSGFLCGLLLCVVGFASFEKGDGAPGTGLIILAVVGFSSFFGAVVGLVKANDALLIERQKSA